MDDDKEVEKTTDKNANGALEETENVEGDLTADEADVSEEKGEPDNLQPEAKDEDTPMSSVAAEDVMVEIKETEAQQQSSAPRAKQPDVTFGKETEVIEVADDKLDDAEAEKLQEAEALASMLSFFKQYLPWFSIAFVGVLLLLVAVILLVTGTVRPQTNTLNDINIPSLQGSMNIHSVDGDELRYTQQLKFIGNIEARNLRRKVEPKLKRIYEGAGLNVDAVLILSFKYGEGDNIELEDEIEGSIDGNGGSVVANGTARLRSALGRAAADSLSGRSLLIRYWVYLEEGSTVGSVTDIVRKVKQAATDEADIVIDIDSIVVTGLANISQAETFSVLSQQGFFQKGLSSLDFELLATIGIVNGPSNIGLQSGDDGLCPGFKEQSNIIVSPRSCYTSTDTYNGMVCLFKCRVPLDLFGSVARVCMSSGHWSGSPVTCKAKCPPIRLGTSGTLLPQFCSSSNATAGQICIVQCSPSHQLYSHKDKSIVGSSYLRQCMEGGVWSGEVAFCKAKCKPLSVPYNFNITTSACARWSLEGDTCSLTCDNGYVLDGGGVEQQLSCDSNGKWNKKLLQCKKVCSPITPSANQLVSPSQCEVKPYEGMKCVFACSAGYKLDGSSIRYCSFSGWTTTVQPACIAACSTLKPDPNGKFTSLSGDCLEETPQGGTECKLMCDVGFAPSSSVVTCSASSGNWTDNNLNCQRTCGKLPDYEHGFWTPSNCSVAPTFEECTLTCEPDYTLVGTAVLTCDPGSGKWSNKPGKCPRNCNPLTNPPDGSVTPVQDCTVSPVTGTACSYSCNLGFSLNGTRTVWCESDGRWSASPVRCIAKTQYLIQTVYYEPKVCLSVADSEGRDVIVKTTDCSSNVAANRWSVEPSMKLKNAYSGQCLMPTLVPGVVQLEDCSGASATANGNEFRGGQHYQIVHDKTGGFLSVGTGSSDVEIVEAAALFSPTASWKLINTGSNASTSLHGYVSGACTPLVASSNMNIAASCTSNNQAVGTKCDISCASGYTLVNGDASVSVVCAAGVWNLTQDVLCVASDGCTQYPGGLLVGGAKTSCTTSKVAIGTTCLFQCNDADERVNGPSSVYCNQQSRWSSYSVVTCSRPCQGRAVRSNMILSFIGTSSCTEEDSLKHGDVCQFSCSGNSELDGAQRTSCIGSGRFDQEEPACAAPCMPLNQANILSVTGCDAKLGVAYRKAIPCKFECVPGYTTSKPLTQCVAGRWDDPDGCVGACHALADATEHVVEPTECSQSPSVPGTTCRVSCNDGFLQMQGNVLVKSVRRTCRTSGLWDGNMPLCSKFCPPLSTDSTGNGYYLPVTCSSRPQRPGFVCHLVCQGLNVVSNGADQLSCSSEGKWVTKGASTQLGSCLRSCAALNQPLYSTVFPHHCSEGLVEPGTECVIECPPTMERIGPGAFRCLGTTSSPSSLGQWSSSQNTRCAALCPPLPRAPNTFIFPQNCASNYKLEGDFCSFECERGLTLSGELALRCTENGKWSNAIPVCHRTCLGIQIFNGRMSCAGLPFDASVGFDHFPGTRCNFVCNEGYAALSHNEVTCTRQGLWNPDPYCRREAESFSIFQKIKNESKCLIVTWNNAHVGSDWILNFATSAGNCVAEGNNALWIWHGRNNLKHVQTGLCITAEMARRESLIVLQACDTENELQQWDCDAWRPYRLQLKGTEFSIDTTYPGIGPLLETWTHARSYWQIYNEELETTGSLCSYRPVGTCPSIDIPNVIVTPDVCSTDDVLTWQTCEITCKPGSLPTGSLPSVECLPTGVWKGIDEVRCVKKCPSLSGGTGTTYTPTSCGTETMDHNSQCAVSCAVGWKLSNDEDSVNMVCDDGEWVGPDVSCTCAPPVPTNGTVSCANETCDIACDPGFKLSSGSPSSVDCSSGVSASSITCEEEKQFSICSKQAIGEGNLGLCLAVDSSSGSATPETRKMMLKSDDRKFYWKWNGDKLQHVATGNCLYSSSTSHWSVLVVRTCEDGTSLNFNCRNHMHPNFIHSPASSTYIGFGQVAVGTPAVLVNRPSSGLVDWTGHQPGGSSGPICLFKAKGQCTLLQVSEFTSIAPSKCDEDSTVGSTCTVSCVGGNRLFNLDTSQLSSQTSITVTCSSTGIWTMPAAFLSVPSCVSTSGTCPSFTLTSGLMVKPAKCMSGDTMETGFQCHFSCKSAYFMEGVSMTYCKSTSTWSSPVPTCKRYCSALSQYKHVTATPLQCTESLVEVGTSCALTCNSGFVSSSSSVNVQCNDDGTWSKASMQCKKSCPLLSSNAYNVTSDVDLVIGGTMLVLSSLACASSAQVEGATCSFSCPPDFILLDGEVQVHCRDGTWTTAIPRCLPVYGCPEVPSTGLVSAVYEPLYKNVAVVSGTVVYLTCIDGYVADGDRERVCEAGGSWSGKGPLTPACVEVCPPLPEKFQATVLPKECTTEYSNTGKSCQLTCQSGTALSTGATTFSTQCVNGRWSSSLPLCVFPSTAEESDSVFTEFMMITRRPELGCFYPDNNDVVRWKTVSQCNTADRFNQWSWTDDQAIRSLGASNKCLQPLQVVNGSGTLGVAACDGSSAQKFSCGNPEASLEWASLYYRGVNVWEMAYVANSFTDRIVSISMNELSNTFQRYDPLNFATIRLTATRDILSEVNRDGSVCSYMCGGRLLDDPSTGYISSPGLMKGIDYPSYSSCQWTIVAFQKLITLTLLHLDLEGDSRSSTSCQTDCLQIYQGLSMNPTSSEHLMTYTGDDLIYYRQRGGQDVLKTIEGSVFIWFKSNKLINRRGFIMKYSIGDIPSPNDCGVPTESWNVPPEDDEPPLGVRPSISRWPWVVSIRKRAERKGKAHHQCTGVLVDDTTVVSAAHCAHFAAAALKIEQGITIGIGRTSQLSMDDDLEEDKVTEVERVYVHSQYDARSRMKDIAVWKLKRTARINSSSQFACKPLDGYAMHHSGLPCYGVGWTQLDNGIVVRRVVQYRMRIEPASYCELTFGLPPNSGFICAAFDRLDNSVSTGTDDSEPLMCLGDNSKWYVVGVASHTRVGRHLTRRLYTSLHANAGWLRETLQRSAAYSIQPKTLQSFDLSSIIDIMDDDGSADASGSGMAANG